MYPHHLIPILLDEKIKIKNPLEMMEMQRDREDCSQATPPGSTVDLIELPGLKDALLCDSKGTPFQQHVGKM